MAARTFSIERTIEGVLFTGLVTSGLLLVAGLAVHADALLRGGIVILMVTPLARVVVLTAGLLRERDYLFGLVSLVVLAVLASGITAAVLL
jgi:uncharacterized membrane protein